MSGRNSSRFDVLVLGGGPAGSTAALVLARAGLSCLLVERSPAPTRGDRPGETLPPAINPLLRSLDLYAAFQATSPLPSYGSRSAWGLGGRPAERDFLLNPYGSGWHVDRPAFDAMLRERARFSGAEVVEGATLGEIARIDERWHIALTGAGATVEAGAVIDASGRTAAFARRLGVRRQHGDRLAGVVAFLAPGEVRSCDATTLVEACPEGWWYSALLPDGRLSLAWFSDPDLLACRRPWRAESLLRLLGETQLTRSRVESGGFRFVAAPRVVAAGTSRLAAVAGEGWLSAGDAAAAYDPLSSHGIGAAIWGGRAAARALLAVRGGDVSAACRYADTIARAYDEGLALGRACYATEQRWPEALFWRRRVERDG